MHCSIVCQLSKHLPHPRTLTGRSDLRFLLFLNLVYAHVLKHLAALLHCG